jgi:hypothetical protein
MKDEITLTDLINHNPVNAEVERDVPPAGLIKDTM